MKINLLKQIIFAAGLGLTTITYSPYAVAETALEAEYSYHAWECSAINSSQAQFITKTRAGIINNHSKSLFVVCPMSVDWAIVRNIRAANGTVMFNIGVTTHDNPQQPNPNSRTTCFGRFYRTVFTGDPLGIIYNSERFNAPLVTTFNPHSTGFTRSGIFVYEPVNLRADATGEPMDSASLHCLLPSAATLAQYSLSAF